MKVYFIVRSNMGHQDGRVVVRVLKKVMDDNGIQGNLAVRGEYVGVALSSDEDRDRLVYVIKGKGKGLDSPIKLGKGTWNWLKEVRNGPPVEVGCLQDCCRWYKPKQKMTAAEAELWGGDE